MAKLERDAVAGSGGGREGAATEAAVAEKAYRKALIKFHPDRHVSAGLPAQAGDPNRSSPPRRGRHLHPTAATSTRRLSPPPDGCHINPAAAHGCALPFRTEAEATYKFVQSMWQRRQVVLGKGATGGQPAAGPAGSGRRRKPGQHVPRWDWQRQQERRKRGEEQTQRRTDEQDRRRRGQKQKRAQEQAAAAFARVEEVRAAERVAMERAAAARAGQAAQGESRSDSRRSGQPGSGGGGNMQQLYGGRRVQGIDPAEPPPPPPRTPPPPPPPPAGAAEGRPPTGRTAMAASQRTQPKR